MHCEINELKKPLEPNTSDKVDVKVRPGESGPEGTGRSVKHGDVYTAVHKVLHDADRRKRHVIVSGTAEDTQTDDAAAFMAICEQYLDMKPAIARCVRLGKRGANALRRLLVRLYRENAATELLKSARSLRHADNSTVRKNVYINQDLLQHTKNVNVVGRRDLPPAAATTELPVDSVVVIQTVKVNPHQTMKAPAKL